MNRRTGSLVPAILAIATMPATAQWPNYPTPGIPRLPDGKPNLTAPAPKNRDGKPNLSGIWSADPQNPKYFGDVAVGFKAGEFPIQPWAETLTTQKLFGAFLRVYLDGRPLPEDPNPTWLRYSVGRWEADTLVVETTGFNGKKWLDQGGHPATDALRTTERFRRRDFGHLDIQFTVDDPKAYTKPWTLNLPQLLYADTELLEFVCNENERDLKHLVDK